MFCSENYEPEFNFNDLWSIKQNTAEENEAIETEKRVDDKVGKKIKLILKKNVSKTYIQYTSSTIYIQYKDSIKKGFSKNGFYSFNCQLLINIYTML